VWAGFGGKLEEKYGESEEDVMEIAKREFCEETAFKDYYSIVPTYVYATPNGTFKFYNFIGLFENEFEPMLNSEHTESKWFSLKDIEDIKSDDIHFGIKLLFMNDPSIIKKYAK
jgi:8-oxo-dGTP pyrophosphatase MutT (NUDIX family)